MGKKSILVVDKDPINTRNLFRSLVKAGYSVTDTPTAKFAWEILQHRSFDVAILDVLTSRQGELDLIGKLREDWSDPLVIVMADFESHTIQESVIRRGADHIIGKPVDIAKLISLISPPPVFSGKVAGVDILEYLQFMLLTGKKTILEVRSQGGYACKLFLNDGNVVHADDGKLEGEDAFYKCLSAEGGTFSNLAWSDPGKTTIAKPGEMLLFEAARKRDESA
ncbi:response regulator [Thermodesulfobacteriota bacterium]